MRGNRLKLLLLLTFAFWATGAAQFLHERLDHQSAAAQTSFAPSASSKSPVASTPRDSAFGHTHADCAVCATLAFMAAHRGVADSPAIQMYDGGLRGAVGGKDTPPKPFEQFLPSRGPPSIAACLAA